MTYFEVIIVFVPGKHNRVSECLILTDWIGLSSVLRPCQHSIGYVGDSFYGSKDPTNSIKVLKEHIVHRHI